MMKIPSFIVNLIITSGVTALAGFAYSAPVTFTACKVLTIEESLGDAKESDLPHRVPTAVSTVYDNKKYDIVSVYHPMATRKGEVMFDINGISTMKLPQKFVIGDGSLKRAFFAIDQRPGTTLDKILNIMVDLIPGNKDAVKNRLQIMEFLKENLALLVAQRWKRGLDQVGDNAWDPAMPEAGSEKALAAAAKIGPGGPPVMTGKDFGAVDFVKFLTVDSCSAYCIQKSILTKLLLDRMKIKAKFVAGAIINVDSDKNGFSTYGHSWVEVPALKAGEADLVLDSNHQVMGPKGERNEIDTDWFAFDGAYRVPNHAWPVLKLPED